MENEPKKISFGFSKLSKKSNLILKPQPTEEKKVEIIEYLEEKSIKVVGRDDKPKGPLVIPMKHPNKKLINLIDIVENKFDENLPESETNNSRKTESQQTATENLTLEEQATKELLNDAKSVKTKEDVNRVIDVSKNADKITLVGEKESTLDDYEEIPVEEFGKAMLRGMGWKDGHGIGKHEQLVKMSQPIQRPKGMGLGADKLTKQDKTEKPAVDRDGNVLKCVKGAYIKIIAGYHKGNYGQIIGLDDESGRFIIKTALNNLNVSLNEFLVIPVTRQDYLKNSKVINNAKYEEYVKRKEHEEKKKQEKVIIKKETSNSSDEECRKKQENSDDEDKKKYTKKEPQSSDNDRNKERTEKYDDRRIKKERHSSDSDYEHKHRKDKYETSISYKREESNRNSRDKHKKSKSRRYSDESDSETERKKSKKKSSKYESDEEKKKHKKKKSKKYSSDDDSEENYKRKTKKSNKKKYDSDSDTERYKKKKDKHREKRERSRHERK